MTSREFMRQKVYHDLRPWGHSWEPFVFLYQILAASKGSKLTDRIATVCAAEPRNKHFDPEARVQTDEQIEQGLRNYFAALPQNMKG